MVGRNVSWAVGLGLAGALVTGACGDGGGGGGLALSVVVDGVPYDLSGNATGYWDSSQVVSIVVGSSGLQYAAIIFIGTTPGVYTGDGSAIWTAEIEYADPAGVEAEASSPGGWCTVNVTGYGAVGEKIEGTFSGVVIEDISGFSHTISGTFSVIRTADL